MTPGRRRQRRKDIPSGTSGKRKSAGNREREKGKTTNMSGRKRTTKEQSESERRTNAGKQSRREYARNRSFSTDPRASL